MKSYRHPEIKAGPDECIDSFLNGRLFLIQSKDGYRFSIDAVLLSNFATIKNGDLIADLGTGCGIISLILLITKPVDCIYGLEIQKDLANQAARNAILNNLENKMRIVQGDIRNVPMRRNWADGVICNPPYRKINSGRINPDPRKAIARHEILISIDDIAATAKEILKKKGRLTLIYPSVRLPDIFSRLRHYGFEPKRLQINHPSLKSPAKLALIEATLGGQPGLEILPPVLGQGEFSISGPR
jgi:tRNA1Val (adenine37-N6)-methyltransferase